MKLNLGSGFKRFDGFINVDSDKYCKPDFIVNLEKHPLPFEDNSVDEVIAHHILEHIGEGYIPLLQEIYRVCKNDAIIDILVPHHDHEVFKNDPTHKRPITVEGLRMFSKSYNRHLLEMNSSTSGLGVIYNVDFEIVSFDYIHDSFYDDIIKTNSPKENERLFREALNTTIETHVVLTCIKT